jgi:riboflavin kinase/FMN adenylyltransferase
MRVYRDIDEVEYDKFTAVTVGTFDGVHLGHREILRKLNSVAVSKGTRSLVVTFEPHPQVVLRSKSPDIRILTTLDEKLSMLSSLNINSVLVIEFTKEFSQTGAEEFYEEYLLKKAGMCDLILGHDHMFGRNREGNYEMMEELSKKYGFDVERVDEYKEGGKNVSSTAIRKLLDTGKVAEAEKYLDRYYSLSGTVIRGRQLGRQLEMPTANIQVDSEYKLIPAKGIYAVVVNIDGREFGGVMNIGINPTVTDDVSLKLEVNIFDFDEEIYDKKIEVAFVDYLRGEEKFPSLDVLKHQMQIDKLNSQKVLETIFNNKITKANN